jgi:hypothetical protein
VPEACARAERLGRFLKRSSRILKSTPETFEDGVPTSSSLVGQVPKSPLDEDEVLVIRKRLRAIQQCYATLLEETPDLSETVRLKFLISSNGSVARANIESVTVHPGAPLSACILAVVREYRFPPVRGGGIAVLTFPFSFENRKGRVTR